MSGPTTLYLRWLDVVRQAGIRLPQSENLSPPDQIIVDVFFPLSPLGTLIGCHASPNQVEMIEEEGNGEREGHGGEQHDSTDFPFDSDGPAPALHPLMPG